MDTKLSFWRIIRNHRYKVFGTFVLLLLENILFLIHPLFIGKAIDGAIVKNYSFLWIMITLYIISIFIGTMRRMVDTRIYSQMHFNIAESILNSPSDSPNAQKISQVELTADIMETINEDIPMFLESVIQIVGSFIILAQFKYSYFTVSLVVLFIIALIYVFITKNVYSLNRQLNDNYESYIRSISTQKYHNFSKYFTRMNHFKIKLSDLESQVYAILYMGILGILVFILLKETTNTQATAGGIFAVIAYVLQFEEGIAELPYLYQKLIGTNEIIHRINGVHDPIDDI